MSERREEPQREARPRRIHCPHCNACWGRTGQDGTFRLRLTLLAWKPGAVEPETTCPRCRTTQRVRLSDV